MLLICFSEWDLTCSTIAGLACENDELCEFPADTCNIVDNGGTCVVTPDACPDLFDSVCGCDSVTYSNDCDRQASEVSKDHDGECDNVSIIDSSRWALKTS